MGSSTSKGIEFYFWFVAIHSSKIYRLESTSNIAKEEFTHPVHTFVVSDLYRSREYYIPRDFADNGSSLEKRNREILLRQKKCIIQRHP